MVRGAILIKVDLIRMQVTEVLLVFSLTKSHCFGCSYKNDTPEIGAKSPSFGPHLDPGPSCRLDRERAKKWTRRRTAEDKPSGETRGYQSVSLGHVVDSGPC